MTRAPRTIGCAVLLLVLFVGLATASDGDAASCSTRSLCPLDPLVLPDDGQIIDWAHVVQGAHEARTAPIVRVVAGDDSQLMALARRLAIPLVFRNTSVSRWRAVGELTPELLLQRGSTMPYAAELPAAHPIARYALPGKPLERVPALRESLRRDFLALRLRPDGVSQADFWLPRAQRGASNAFCYVSEHAAAVSLRGATDGLLSLAGNTSVLTAGLLAPGETQPALRVWMGSDGTVAQTHYDESHNAFVQVAGRKRFFVHPPRSALVAQLHPHLHPGARLSQLDFGAHAEHEQGGGPARLGAAWVVDLGPGDWMYLPPFWLHRVTALSHSISFNVWVPLAGVQALHSLAARIQAPLDPADLALFVALSLDALADGTSAALAAELVLERYRPLLGDDAGTFDAPCTPSAERSAYLRRAVGVTYLAQLRQLLEPIDDAAIRRLVMFDFVETVVHRALCTPDAPDAPDAPCVLRVPAFLARCVAVGPSRE